MEIVVIAVLVLGAVAAVVTPLIRKPATDALVRDDAAIERAVASYRAALKAGTVCQKCLRDNPEGSKYCADCGGRLG